MGNVAWEREEGSFIETFKSLQGIKFFTSRDLEALRKASKTEIVLTVIKDYLFPAVVANICLYKVPFELFAVFSNSTAYRHVLLWIRSMEES